MFFNVLGYYRSLKVEMTSRDSNNWSVRSIVKMDAGSVFFLLKLNYEKEEAAQFVRISSENILFLHEVRLFNTTANNMTDGRLFINSVLACNYFSIVQDFNHIIVGLFHNR